MSKKRNSVLAFVVAILACSLMLVSCAGDKSSSSTTTSSSSTTSTAVENTSSDKVPSQADKTLVIAVPTTFEEKWNPVLAESAYDMQAMEQVFVSPMRKDADNLLIPYAGNVTYEEVKDENGNTTSVAYTVSIQEGMTFTNGDPVTIDDYIYTLYVCSDPSYTGPLALVNYDIAGMKEYYYDDVNYAGVVADFDAQAAEKYSLDVISEEDFVTYLVSTDIDGQWTAMDLAGWADYITTEGFADELAAIDANDEAAVKELVAKVEYANYRDSYDPQTWWASHLAESYIDENLEDGVSVPEISGVKKVDDYTCTVTFNSIDIIAEELLGLMQIMPHNYYGEFEKGDVSAILANMNPVGSGPYKFVGFSDNIVTLEANPDFFLGVPNIGTVKLQVVMDSDLLPSMAQGLIDIGNPTGTQENIAEMEALGIEYDLIPFAGFGYAGFNCNTLPLEVRKGLFCLMNRESSVVGYYGDIAQVIERPMVPTLAEYPHDAEAYYPYSPEEALKHFEAAGYTQKNGKLVNDKGEQLVVSAYIGGSGKGDHPAYAMLIGAAEDLATLGGELQINDVEFAVLQGAMNDGSADIWVMAWGNVLNCDRRDQFRSTGGQNKYGIADPELDALLDQIVTTLDFDARAELVSQMLDKAMDLAFELPVYQRNDIIAYNPQTVDLTTLPERSTGFWDYSDQLWQLKML